MAKSATSGGKGGRRKIGRSKREPKHSRYVSSGTWLHNKKKRILRSCGEAFLQAWLTARGKA